MRRHILLPSSTEEKEVLSHKTSMRLPLSTCTTKVRRDQQSGVLTRFDNEDKEHFLFDTADR